MDGLDARALSKIVLADDFRLDKAPTVDLVTLAGAIDELSNPVALLDEDPGLKGDTASRIDRNLRYIGAKVDPRINDEQALAWRVAVLLALSDLPGRIAEYATRKAIHKPFRFLNEVETTVREIAEEATQKQRTAAWRLKLWRDEVERSLNPQPRLEAPTETMTQEQVDEANAIFERTSIKTRYRIGESGEVETYQIKLDPQELAKEEERKTAKIDPG